MFGGSSRALVIMSQRTTQESFGFLSDSQPQEFVVWSVQVGEVGGQAEFRTSTMKWEFPKIMGTFEGSPE